MANTNLTAARKARKDEFYTQWAEIEKEMNAYLEYNPDVFRDKTILLPCDDPEWSNFTKFFALHFMDFGLKKLISTSYAPESNAGGMFYQPSLFETEAPVYDEHKSFEKGRVFVLEKKDVTGDGRIDIDDLRWEYLAGDGDFRSQEVTDLRDKADIVITNGPFSLFREFIAWLLKGEVRFSIIGNMNASKYKEVFPLFQKNLLWYGPSISSGDREFRVPDSYPMEAAGQRIDDDGQKYIRVKGVRWFTNIDHGRRHEPLQLMTMDDNIKYSRHQEVRERVYRRYANFDAIEVPYTDAIPSDYLGTMGVPISFLDRFAPEQFEITGTSQGWYGANSVVFPRQTQVSKDGKVSTVTKLNDQPALEVDGPQENTTYYIVGDKHYVATYARIFIKRRQA